MADPTDAITELIRQRWDQVRCGLSPALPGLEADTARALAGYFQLLSAWTEEIDLVANRSPVDLFSIHGADALIAHKIIFPDQAPGPVLDVGSGAGLPGMVWAIIDPARPYHLCEPREKRVVFLKECRRRLGMKNVTIHLSRLEHCPKERFQVISFRALRPEGMLLKEAEERLAPGGAITWLAGADAAEGFQPRPYRLPDDTKGRQVLVRVSES